MTRTTLTLLALAVGMAAGYHLPALRERSRLFIRARTFKPVLLRPFQPVPRDKHS